MARRHPRSVASCGMRIFSYRSGRRTGAKPQLRALHSPDVADLPAWQAPASFAICVQLIVGPEGEPGEESFDITLCTPDQLAREASREGITDGRHHFVVDHYDFDAFDRYIRRRISACEGTSWDEVTTKLARIGRWEFEDYAE